MLTPLSPATLTVGDLADSGMPYMASTTAIAGATTDPQTGSALALPAGAIAVCGP